MPTAIDISGTAGLIAVGIFTAQILLGLLISVGYNPVRRWPRVRGLKLSAEDEARVLGGNAARLFHVHDDLPIASDP